jgi:hypothetical protein
LRSGVQLAPGPQKNATLISFFSYSKLFSFHDASTPAKNFLIGCSNWPPVCVSETLSTKLDKKDKGDKSNEGALVHFDESS